MSRYTKCIISALEQNRMYTGIIHDDSQKHRLLHTHTWAAAKSYSRAIQLEFAFFGVLNFDQIFNDMRDDTFRSFFSSVAEAAAYTFTTRVSRLSVAATDYFAYKSERETDSI